MSPVHPALHKTIFKYSSTTSQLGKVKPVHDNITGNTELGS